MNNLKDFMLGGLIESTKFNEYKYQIHLVVTEELIVPEHIKTQYPIGSLLILSLISSQNSQPEIDYNTKMISWRTSFNTIPFWVSIPINSIVGVHDVYSKFGVQFGIIEEQSNQPKKDIENKDSKKPKPELTVHINENKDFKRTPKKGNLHIVDN